MTASAPPAPRPWSGRRGWALAAAGVVAVFLVLGLLSDGLAPAPQGPAGSSYATSAPGVAAWAQLLTRAGHPVARLRAPLQSAALDPGSTLVVLGAPALSPQAASRVRRFVSAGGRLVIGGGDAAATLPRLISDPPRVVGGGSRTAAPPAGAAGLAEVAGVRSVRTAGEGRFVISGGGVALTGAGGALLVVRHLGGGAIDLLADLSPVQNRLLASADNAQLALDLAGGRRRPVAFAEAVHGYGEATGLAAIPTRWWLTFAGLSLAAGAWALARGRRLGPAQPPAPPGVPPRGAYVDALGASLTRAKDFPAR
jgi:hypothetical protein